MIKRKAGELWEGSIIRFYPNGRMANGNRSTPAEDVTLYQVIFNSGSYHYPEGLVMIDRYDNGINHLRFQVDPNEVVELLEESDVALLTLQS